MRFLNVTVLNLAILSVLALFAPPPTSAQTLPPDLARQAAGMGLSEGDIVRRLQESGLTREQARARLRAAGYDPGLVDPYYDRMEGREGAIEAPSTTFLEALNRIGVAELGPSPALADTDGPPLSVLAEIPTTSEDEDEVPIFGRAVFKRPSTQFDPVTFGPVDPQYRLGPQDEVSLVLTGDVELAYSLTVNREGVLIIPDVGPVPVNGLTLEGLRIRLYAELGRVYSGVRRDASATTQMQVSLGRLRTNLVYVIGEVESPGAYPVSAAATAFTALHRAGGPTRQGSFRRVEVRRAGTLVAEIDLYDYLVRGDASRDIRLEQGDILFVPPRGAQIGALGQFRREARYELLPGETMDDLVQYAGGFRAEAWVRRVLVDRILPPTERTVGRERVLLDVDVEALQAGESAFPLQDGDLVEVFAVIDERRDRVAVQGAVHRPGPYAYAPGMTLGELLERAGGTLSTAFSPAAHIRRLREADGGQILYRISLEEPGPAGLGFVLEDRDQVQIFQVDSLRPADEVEITGLVSETGTFLLADGATVEDVILKAGGFTVGADPFVVEVARRRLATDLQDSISVAFTVILSGAVPYPDPDLLRGEVLLQALDLPSQRGGIANDAFQLRDGDRIFVRPLPGFQTPSAVTVQGEVLRPGRYPLLVRQERLSSVITRAGGSTEAAHFRGARLIRQGLPVGVELERALEHPGGEEDVALEDGDILILPRLDPTVAVQGAVLFNSRVRYRSGFGFWDYVEQAGGPSGAADLSRVSIEYASGERALAKRRTFWFDVNPPVEPGSTIFIPTRPEGDVRTDWGEIINRTVGITTSVLTTLILIQRL